MAATVTVDPSAKLKKMSLLAGIRWDIWVREIMNTLSRDLSPDRVLAVGKAVAELLNSGKFLLIPEINANAFLSDIAQVYTKKRHIHVIAPWWTPCLFPEKNSERLIDCLAELLAFYSKLNIAVSSTILVGTTDYDLRKCENTKGACTQMNKDHRLFERLVDRYALPVAVALMNDCWEKGRWFAEIQKKDVVVDQDLHHRQAYVARQTLYDLLLLGNPPPCLLTADNVHVDKRLCSLCWRE